MTVLSALALSAGFLTSLGALWTVHVVSVQQSGRGSQLSLVVCGGFGATVALLAYLALHDLYVTSAALAAGTAVAAAVTTDLRFGQLADLTSLIVAICALAAAPRLTVGLGYLEMVISAGLAAGILALAGLYGRLRRGEPGLGAGDVLLAGALGLWCPVVTATLGVALGAGLTLIAGVVLKARPGTRLPFAPGLAAGFILAFILEKLT